MSETDYEALATALNRAWTHRAAGVPRYLADQWITVRLRSSLGPVPERCGWEYAGVVMDGIVGQELAVWWNPATDAVQVQRPHAWDDA